MLTAVIQPGWQFPVVLSIWHWRVPIHLVCDVIAYTLGFRWYLYLRRTVPGPANQPEQNGWIIVGCIFGALCGAKILAWMEDPFRYWSMRNDPGFWFGGNTIVGGLLGGWAGIEIAKSAVGVTRSLGDTCVAPMILGMCIGRVGCFLTGVSDETCGLPTKLPWGVDYGDGIPRHPAQIYEILFLAGLAVLLWSQRTALNIPGLKFRWFLLAYLAFRLSVDFLKPHGLILGGLSGIQWGCVVGIAVCAFSLRRLRETTATATAYSHG